MRKHSALFYWSKLTPALNPSPYLSATHNLFTKLHIEMTLENVYDSIAEQIDFENDPLEAVVKKAFMLGGKSQAALLKLQQKDPESTLGDYTDGIVKVVKPIGQFVDDLDEDQLASYKAGLKAIITHPDAEVEAVLEEFGDYYLDTVVAVDDMKEEINSLTGGG